jgi:hypothetical protein
LILVRRGTATTKKLLYASAWVVLLFCPELARAQDPLPHREHVRFSYRAPEGCPTESAFLDLVRARDAEIIADDQAPRTLSIAIDFDEKWHASLQTEGIANGKAQRAIDGDTCEAVARTIAIFTAIALREGSPDELPPAHPELAQKESLETPEEGFIPMARPHRPGPPVLDLYRGRFALTASESFTMINDGGRSLATTIGAAYFASNVFGIGVEGGVHVNLPPSDEISSDLVAVHALGYLEFVWMRAKAAMLAPDRGRTLDLFSRFGAGVMWARPRPQNSLQYVDHPYAAGFYFQPSLGVRVFVSDDVALSFETHLDFYDQQNLDDRYDNVCFDQTGSVPCHNETFAVGGGFQIGITWFPSKANRWSP